MSQPQPITRHELQQLKVKNDEQKRLNTINKYVNSIYNSLINQVRSSNTSSNTSSNITSYNYQINQVPTIDPDYLFIERNKDEILNGLKVLFPDCLVDFKKLSRGTDGKMYDVSNIDEKMKTFINRQNDREYIVIDWS